MDAAAQDRDGQAPTGKHHAIVFALDPQAATGNEGYRLTITPQRVVISAAHSAGLFYATRTLRQLLLPAIYANTRQRGVAWEMPTVCCKTGRSSRAMSTLG